MFTGPNIVRDGLVLALDAANTKSFRGPSQTNLITGINHSYGTTNTATFKTTSGTLDVNIPRRGRRTVKYLDIFNDYNGGSGVCCPNLFNFGDFTVSSSTTYVYSIVYKSVTGYTHPNYMYRYEYNGNTYVTEGGVHSTSNRTALGDGWYHAWGTFTTQATTNRLITYLFHYEYGTYNRVFVDSVQITQGSYIGAPEHMLAPSENRGTTVATGGGWADKSENSNHGTLTNGPLFNSGNGGSIVFDGVNDYVVMSSPGSYSNYTFEFYCKWVSNTQNLNRVFGLSNFGTYTVFNQSNVGFHYNPVNYNPSSTTVSSGVNVGFGNWCHVAVSVNSSATLVTIYVNGIARNTTSLLPVTNFSGNIFLGAQNTSTAVSANCQIANFSLYNRVLSDSEVLQNYNATKSRFGL